MILYLHPDLLPYFSPQKPLFDQIMALRGESFRHQDGRLTQRISLGQQHYFIKQHTGVGFKEIIKNLLHLRLPVISAKNEWCAIKMCHTIGVLAPRVLGFGQRGWNPASLESFILMEELAPIMSLEEVSKTWIESKPIFDFKRQLIAKVAYIARTLHCHGLNHRDFYLCHFLLQLPLSQQAIKLYLIDLHRAQIRHKIPRRWLIKDLAALYFSSKDIGLTKRDLYRFIKAYSGSTNRKSLREIFHTQYDYWQKVKKRGEQLYCDHSK